MRTIPGHILRREICSVIAAFAGHRVKVTFGGTEAFTNGVDEITLPALSHIAIYDARDARILRGYANHEVAHITESTVPKRVPTMLRHMGLGSVAQKAESTLSKKLDALLAAEISPDERIRLGHLLGTENVFEDYRIEREQGRKYPGSHMNLDVLRDYVVNDEASIFLNPELAVGSYTAIDIGLAVGTWLGAIENRYSIAPLARMLCDRARDELDPEAYAVVEAAWPHVVKAKTNGDIYPIAAEIGDRLIALDVARKKQDTAQKQQQNTSPSSGGDASQSGPSQSASQKEGSSQSRAGAGASTGAAVSQDDESAGSPDEHAADGAASASSKQPVDDQPSKSSEGTADPGAPSGGAASAETPEQGGDQEPKKGPGGSAPDAGQNTAGSGQAMQSSSPGDQNEQAGGANRDASGSQTSASGTSDQSGSVNPATAANSPVPAPDPTLQDVYGPVGEVSPHNAIDISDIIKRIVKVIGSDAAKKMKDTTTAGLGAAGGGIDIERVLVEPEAGDADRYKDIAESARAVSGRVSGAMRSLMLGRARRTERRGLDDGHFDSRALHDIAIGSGSIYKQRAPRIRVSGALLLLCDVSISMRAQVDDEKTALGLLAEAVTAMNDGIGVNRDVKVALVSFTAKSSGRCETIMNVHKSFDRPFTAMRTGIGQLGRVHNGGTPTAYALLDALAMMHPRTEHKRVITLITDGEPDNKKRALDAANCVTASGIKMTGLGIGENAPVMEIPDWRNITDIHDLPNALIDLAKRNF